MANIDSMVVMNPEPIRSIAVSQDVDGGICVVQFGSNAYDGSVQVGIRARELLGPSQPPALVEINETVTFFGDLLEARLEIALQLLKGAHTVTFTACSGKFIHSILSRMERSPRHLTFSWCWLDGFPEALQGRLWSISVCRCWCKPGIFAGLSAATVNIRLPEETSWYVNVIPTCSNCFIVANDEYPPMQLVRCLNGHSSLRGLFLSKVILDVPQLSEILSIPANEISIQGFVSEANAGHRAFTKCACQHLDMRLLEFSDDSILAACIRDQVSLKELNISVDSFDVPLLTALASLSNLETLSIDNCRTFTRTFDVKLPWVKTVRLGKEAATRKRWILRIFPGAEISFL